ncbi:hypothetical protein HYDPIDRAFT_24246 [Hydnomerulius pinastri MD-312]|nr:hypothetical protein HYDPIDRAFT_24246 [Hydnomerulius pinastri MD-312]
MNLGLRDAIFLGEALTKHMKTAEHKSLAEADTILKEFAAIRHARALEVIGFTKNLLSFAGMKYQERMFWWLPKKLAWNLSGLGRR